MIEKAAQETVAGPSLTFSKLHAYKAIVLLGELNFGRNALSKEIGIGSGAVRTLISKLMKMNLVTVKKSGCQLTKKGESIKEEMLSRIPSSKPIDAGRLSVGKFDHGVIVRGAAERIRSGIEQRDAAIVQGAKGATTIIFKSGKFVLGDSVDCEKDFPNKVWKSLRALQPKDGDVIIVSSSETARKAEYGALAAVWPLLDA